MAGATCLSPPEKGKPREATVGGGGQGNEGMGRELPGGGGSEVGVGAWGTPHIG